MNPPTYRQHEVWSRVAAAMTNKEIAADLAISPSTVRETVEILTTKLGVKRRVRLALLWHGIRS